MAVKNAAELRGFSKGTWVRLRAYRKARGNNKMDSLREELIGEKAIIRGYPQEKNGSIKKDSSGCFLISVQVKGKIIGNNMFGGHQLTWRLSSMRKI